MLWIISLKSNYVIKAKDSDPVLKSRVVALFNLQYKNGLRSIFEGLCQYNSKFQIIIFVKDYVVVERTLKNFMPNFFINEPF